MCISLINSSFLRQIKTKKEGKYVLNFRKLSYNEK